MCIHDRVWAIIKRPKKTNKETDNYKQNLMKLPGLKQIGHAVMTLIIFVSPLSRILLIFGNVTWEVMLFFNFWHFSDMKPKGQVALEDKTVYVKNLSSQLKTKCNPVCSPKDKIWSRTDKLQRCRRLPLEQAKLRQILENNSEGVLIRKWFDRWYVAESLCYRLRCKINHVLISQQHEYRRGRPIFSVRISTISTRMDLSFARPLHV